MSSRKKTINLKTQSMSKRKKLSRVDRISDLPDSLLCKILSFLPTKEVVATSVLSSRWTTLWTYVPCLDFEGTTDCWEVHDLDHDNPMSFTHFVCRVLTLLKAPALETFRLDCGVVGEGIDPIHLNTWICAALERGVKELDLSFSGNTVYLPRSTFTCESLVVLKLGDSISLDCSSHIHLPSLKILHVLADSENDEEDSVDKLISGCPILEELDVQRFLWDVTTFNISIPTLKSLEVHISDATSESKVQINTPSLDNLVIRDGYPADYLLDKLPNLVQADVKISLDFNRDDDENYDDCVLKLLRGLYNVRILSFSDISGGINTSFVDLPLFHNLVDLSLRVDSFECHVLKTLLENSPNLKILDIHNKTTYEGRESCWSQPSRVPECLSSHLETFKVSGFQVDGEFVKYILKNSSVLATMTVNTIYLPELEENDLIKKVSMFPRGSKTCQLAFHRGVFSKGTIMKILEGSIIKTKYVKH